MKEFVSQSFFNNTGFSYGFVTIFSCRQWLNKIGYNLFLKACDQF